VILLDVGLFGRRSLGDPRQAAVDHFMSIVGEEFVQHGRSLSSDGGGTEDRKILSPQLSRYRPATENGLGKIRPSRIVMIVVSIA
jgi:hypothetical protein